MGFSCFFSLARAGETINNEMSVKDMICIAASLWLLILPAVASYETLVHPKLHESFDQGGSKVSPVVSFSHTHGVSVCMIVFLQQLLVTDVFLQPPAMALTVDNGSTPQASRQ